MKAITIEEFGNADVLKLNEVPNPEIRPTDLPTYWCASMPPESIGRI
jgi:hypothetical protein